MNNINWKLRFKNKAVLLALITCSVSFVYQILGILGLTSPVSEDIIMQFVAVGLNILVALGILIDPTTKGICDSNQAKEYTEPK
ncbi:phage holin [Anaerovorax odorimutans]|uniref:phage holin n=1 Tax=Anaerovorax odorimutans TaxID=109327 RepID=UPI000423938B|nr:phage holin [Anaerovorax odorimutans]